MQTLIVKSKRVMPVDLMVLPIESGALKRQESMSGSIPVSPLPKVVAYDGIGVMELAKFTASVVALA
ncbi:hypothetical protein MKK70_07895, partial [Methylobacterium sp. E-041]|uniref:hypothetical protein n=1 Tax=Methylobacterium sp. E-041 TaxID=2836573 RepID=UPI001FB940D9